MNAQSAKSRLKSLSTPENAKTATWFFKTGPGQYGEGDKFIGVKVPAIRSVAREFKSLPFEEIETLLTSPIHEERALALFVLVHQFPNKEDPRRKIIFDFYWKHKQHVNNWDLVDSSAPAIVGGYLLDKSHKPLHTLAKSKSLWDRRIAIVSTLHFIRHDDFDDTLTISATLLHDTEDLIHKAVGWMLREVGDRDAAQLRMFLKHHLSSMPRTMLRYAIEKFPKTERDRYLRGNE